MKLIFEDSVHALMSSLGGRSAHLAEQIVAKARVAVAAGHPQPRQFSYEKSDSNFQNLLAQIEQTKIEAIVLFLQTSRTVKKLVQQMRVRQIDPALFGPLTLIDEAFLNMTDSGLDGAVFSSTAGAAVSGWRLICGLGWGSNAAARLAESAAHKVSHLFTITYAIYFSNINFRVSENLPACNL